MDASKEYIAMCDCDEVRGRWKKEKGDWAFDREEGETYAFTDSYSCKRDSYILVAEEYQCESEGSFGAIAKYPDSKDDEYIWLPRQDQIQEMVGGGSGSLSKFYKFARSEMEDTHTFPSYEQLWLAFYMREKHGKTWNGKKWVKHNAK